MSDQIVVSSKYVPKWAHVIVTCHELAGKEHAQDSSFRRFQPVLTEALHESPAFVLEIKSAQNPSHRSTSQTFSLNLKVAMISVTVGTYRFRSNRSSQDHWWCIYLERMFHRSWQHPNNHPFICSTGSCSMIAPFSSMRKSNRFWNGPTPFFLHGNSPEFQAPLAFSPAASRRRQSLAAAWEWPHRIPSKP